PAVQYLNRIPTKKKVLFWWNADPIAFYLDGETSLVFSHFFDRLTGDNPSQMHRVVLENGVTHVVAGRLYGDQELFTNPEGEVVRRYLRQIYLKNAMVVYE